MWKRRRRRRRKKGEEKKTPSRHENRWGGRAMMKVAVTEQEKLKKELRGVTTSSRKAGTGAGLCLLTHFDPSGKEQ